MKEGTIAQLAYECISIDRFCGYNSPTSIVKKNGGIHFMTFKTSIFFVGN